MSEQKKSSVHGIDVAYVARLARLYLSEDEQKTFQKQLEQIVEYVRKIDRLDLEKVEPASHSQQINNVFREDEVFPGLDRDTVIANAPEEISGQFKVPRIVE